MEKLINHIENDISPSMFMDDNDVCAYNYVVARLYRLLADALIAESDSFVLTPITFTWLQGNDVVDSEGIDYPKPTVSYYSQFHTMLQYDSVLQEHLKIIVDTPDKVICEFVIPER